MDLLCVLLAVYSTHSPLNHAPLSYTHQQEQQQWFILKEGLGTFNIRFRRLLAAKACWFVIGSLAVCCPGNGRTRALRGLPGGTSGEGLALQQPIVSWSLDGNQYQELPVHIRKQIGEEDCGKNTNLWQQWSLGDILLSRVSWLG